MIITNWENDLIEHPEDMVQKFVAEKYPNHTLKFLSGLKQRSFDDIYESIKESRIIVMQPALLDKPQVTELVKSISHPIHTGLNGASRHVEIRDFVFYSLHPFEDLMTIKSYCEGVTDGRDTADALAKILSNCEIHFYGFEGEHYEMRCSGWQCRDIYAVRYEDIKGQL